MKRFAAQTLRERCAAVLRGAGSSEEEAASVARNLVFANLSGHDSHGVGMVPRYVDAVLEGGLQPNARAAVVLDVHSLMTLDGQRGYGQVVGEDAMRLAIARARETGSCICALANAHHLGRIGHFAEMAVAEGLVSLHFVNVLSRPIVAPWGGADARYGTNPCCIGIPLRGREPFVLDFATSRVAQGKMRVAYNEGRRVQEGLLIDEQGRPTTDPGVAVVPQAGGLFGALLPFGEHKGYGLAVACELLGGALTGGGTLHRPADGRSSVVNGMLTVVIDPERLGTGSAFEQEALAFVDWLRQSPHAPDSDKVRIAGEPERTARAQREREGIEVDETTWSQIVAAGGKVGVGVTHP
ncbi:MAG TPA: malate/lactate/ureidoglycolate dehydrogenase [Ramlibacter sp.]|uniref:malate/lactate/ureidoglycolate dehydrogenase n=1 Tax=Ramlibacter sp. TaxID=1917967 RepID=UPI002CE683DD|nr:malate/lactate/ureidoglycolate dehydrogenase [Ramlibacter sp.]HVZ45916.1 malate/lactate/ureidoglycolate dehydrogenase [Ramlibacter sp.]